MLTYSARSAVRTGRPCDGVVVSFRGGRDMMKTRAGSVGGVFACVVMLCCLVNVVASELAPEPHVSLERRAGGLALDIWGGRDLQSAFSVAHLAGDIVKFNIRKRVSMQEMGKFPAPSVSRDLLITGYSAGEESSQIIDAADCSSKINIQPGVKVTMKDLVLDLRGCNLVGIGDKENDLLHEWLFSLGAGSHVVYKDLEVMVTRSVLRELGRKKRGGGGTIPQKTPQTFAIDWEGYSNRMVSFRNVGFLTVGNKDKETAMSHGGRKAGMKYGGRSSDGEAVPVIHKVTTEDDLWNTFAGLTEMEQEVGPHEIWVQNNMSFSNKSLHITDNADGGEHNSISVADVVIKSGGQGMVTLTWMESFFSSPIFTSRGDSISLENIRIETHEFLPPLPGCYYEDCLRSAWAVFPSFLEGYECHFIMKNITIQSSCDSIHHSFKTLMFANFWKDRTLEEIRSIDYEVPYVKMDRKGDHLLRVHEFARKGLCMENVLIECADSILSMSQGDEAKQTVGASVVFAVTVSLGLLGLLFCSVKVCKTGGQSIPKVKWMMQSKFHFSSRNGQHPPMSTSGSLQTSYVTASSMPANTEPVNPMSARSCWSPDSPKSCGWDGPQGSRSLKDSRVSLERAMTMTSIGGRLSRSSMELRDDVVSIEEQIGAGGYGIVYRGKWKGLDIAIKTVTFHDLPGELGKDRRRAVLEAAISASVAHENVVQTLAYCFKPIQVLPSKRPLDVMKRRRPKGRKWKMYIIQEYCDGGSLRAALRDRIFQDPQTNRSVDFGAILRVALDIAQGMKHLHADGIIHGDLTSKNIMLKTDGSGFAAKIGDFGLSIKIGESDAAIPNHRAGTPFYVAPEVYHDGLLSKHADVYSFGVLLWELYHQRAPFEKRAEGKYRYHHRFPKFPVHCPMPYALLCIICLSPRMKERPSFHFVRHILTSMIMKEEKWSNWQEIEAENTRLSRELEGLDSRDLHLYVDHLVNGEGNTAEGGEKIFRHGDTGGLGFLQSTCHSDLPKDRLRIRSNIESLMRVASSELSMKNGDWERKVEEIISAGVPLSVTVLPPGSEASGSATGNWSESQSPSLSESPSESPSPCGSMMKVCSGNTQLSTMWNIQNATGGSNAFSVTVDEQLWVDQSGSSCGELKFRWSPFVMVNAELAKQGPNKFPLNNGNGQDSEKDERVRGRRALSDPVKINIQEIQSQQDVAIEIMSSGDASNEIKGYDEQNELNGLAVPPMESRGMTQFQLGVKGLEKEMNGEVNGMHAIENRFQGRGWMDWDDWEDSSRELAFEYTSPPEGVSEIYLSQNPLFAPGPRGGEGQNQKPG